MVSFTQSNPRLSYFNCTLGEAAELSLSGHGVGTDNINDFLDNQAASHPNLPALGFPVLTDNKSSYELFTFKDLRDGSSAVADDLDFAIKDLTKANNVECVALLCPSSTDFVFAWLGLIRLGYSVLLIAPQCQPSAIISLVESCHVTLIFYDTIYTDLAKQASLKSQTGLTTALLPWQLSNSNLSALRNSTPSRVLTHKTKQSDIAYIHHSSGTSSGIPKPIPQTHFAAVGALPRLDGSLAATFSTTPLYHGGIADCFRSWTSNAMIWLFPASVPVTARNIIRCIATSNAATHNEPHIPAVKYLSCVPFVLSLLAEETEGLKILRMMEMVGVGGASLSPKIGNTLVKQGVNLLSRFGSSECGFLLSSGRDFQVDHEWQYLRVPNCNKGLIFEPLTDGSNLAELIVCNKWPYLAKTNRPDLSFATCDLFESHSTIRDAWRYHSRSDGRIMLSTGKKFDPTPLEDNIAAASPIIKDVFIIGTDRHVPGALVFLHKSEDVDTIKNIVMTLSFEGEAHTRISQDMVLVMPLNSHKVLKSSKGTILRGPTEELFTREIRELYDKGEGKEHAISNIADDQIQKHVRHIVGDILGHQLEIESDFYASGVDSIKSSQIRAAILKDIMHSGLPRNIVYDCGNIRSLAEYLLLMRSGKEDVATPSNQDEMIQMLDKYTIFSTPPPAKPSEGNYLKPGVVVLTGATGALGANILQTLRNDPSISSILCLVRAPHTSIARDRVSESLNQRRHPGLSVLEHKICCLPCRLDLADLGLSSNILHLLREEITHFIHAAWNVNFSLPLRGFAEDLAGLHNIINLIFSCKTEAKLTFCSSTASVLSSKSTIDVRENISTSPSDSAALGYAKSKWVAEAMCARALEHSTRGATIKIIRIGQLTGHSETGVWNTSEAWPLMLSTVDALGCLPYLEQPLNWLPLDIAANAVVEISMDNNLNQTSRPTIFHVVNNSRTPIWSNLLGWIQQARPQSFEIVSLREWLMKLDRLQEHPAKRLLGLWESGVGNTKQENVPEHVSFSTQNSAQIAAAMRDITPLDERFVRKMWDWLDRTMNN